MQILTLSQFEEIISSIDKPVILLEGKRAIPEEYYRRAVKLGMMLAQKYPDMIFRSGNAGG